MNDFEIFIEELTLDNDLEMEMDKLINFMEDLNDKFITDSIKLDNEDLVKLEVFQIKTPSSLMNKIAINHFHAKRLEDEIKYPNNLYKLFKADKSPNYTMSRLMNLISYYAKASLYSKQFKTQYKTNPKFVEKFEKANYRRELSVDFTAIGASTVVKTVFYTKDDILKIVNSGLYIKKYNSIISEIKKQVQILLKNGDITRKKAESYNKKIDRIINRNDKFISKRL